MISTILWIIIIVVLLVAWLFGGFVLNVGGLIHLLLVILVIVLLVNLILSFGGRRLD